MALAGDITAATDVAVAIATVGGIGLTAYRARIRLDLLSRVHWIRRLRRDAKELDVCLGRIELPKGPARSKIVNAIFSLVLVGFVLLLVAFALGLVPLDLAPLIGMAPLFALYFALGPLATATIRRIPSHPEGSAAEWETAAKWSTVIEVSVFGVILFSALAVAIAVTASSLDVILSPRFLFGIAAVVVYALIVVRESLSVSVRIEYQVFDTQLGPVDHSSEIWLQLEPESPSGPVIGGLAGIENRLRVARVDGFVEEVTWSKVGRIAARAL